MASPDTPSFEDRDGWIWLDGELVPWRDARVHVLSHALHYGSSVFEGQRAYGGTVFKLAEHTERLHQSARLLGFELPYSADEINAACMNVLEANNCTDAYVRPVAWRGAESMGVAPGKTRPHVAIAAWEWGKYFDPEKAAKGLRLDIASYRRPAPYTAPVHSKAAGLYMICTIARQQAEARGYDDALMFDYRGLVAEATGANVFFVKDGSLHTPIPDCFLNGITRQSVIAIAKERRIPVIERHIKPEEMADFSECFLTGSAAEVTPVSEIGPYRFKPGKLTERLMNAYADEVRGVKVPA
jgi:branched-chain amino acid aminotransferase